MTWTQDRSRLGVLERLHRDKTKRPPEVQQEIDRLRLELRVHKLAEQIKQVAPDLTPAQATRLRSLLDTPSEG